MGLMDFKDWLTVRESAPITRSKTASSYDVGPDVADVFGHATPPPWQVKKLLAKNKKHTKKHRCDVPVEERARTPDYSIDKLYRRAESDSDSIDKEIKQAEDQIGRLERQVKGKPKSRPERDPKPSPFNKRPNPFKSNDDDDDDDDRQDDQPQRKPKPSSFGKRAENPRQDSMEEVWSHLYEQSEKIVPDSPSPAPQPGRKAAARPRNNAAPNSMEDIWDSLLEKSDEYIKENNQEY